MSVSDQLEIILRAIYRVFSIHPDVPTERFKKETNSCLECIKNLNKCQNHKAKQTNVESEYLILKTMFPIKAKEILDNALIEAGIEIPNEYKN